MLQAHLRGEQPPFTADTLSQVVEEVQIRGREITLVDREVTKYWVAEFFSRQIKHSPGRVYPAILLGWIRAVSFGCLESCTAAKRGPKAGGGGLHQMLVAHFVQQPGL